MRANEVLENVNKMIEAGSNRKGMKWKIGDVYDELGIFDWWNEYLSVSQLKQMKKFLETAIGLGYTGYVCFKVGAKYCSHGMWAYKADSRNGYSPDGACLHHSFRNGDNYWDVCLDDGKWVGTSDHYKLTLKEVKAAIA